MGDNEDTRESNRTSESNDTDGSDGIEENDETSAVDSVTLREEGVPEGFPA